VTKLILRLERLADAAADGSAAPGAEPAAPRSHHVVDLGDHSRAPAASTPLARWIATVAAAHDPCLVLDTDAAVVSMSVSAAELLGCTEGVIGRRLLDVVDVVDFDTGRSAPDYAPRVAPIAVLTTGTGLMRSLLRIRQRDGVTVTVDAAAAPIHDASGVTVGSFTFFAAVRAG
jgi:PAS domain-containing protein